MTHEKASVRKWSPNVILVLFPEWTLGSHILVVSIIMMCSCQTQHSVLSLPWTVSEMHSRVSTHRNYHLTYQIILKTSGFLFVVSPKSSDCLSYFNISILASCSISDCTKFSAASGWACEMSWVIYFMHRQHTFHYCLIKYLWAPS